MTKRQILALAMALTLAAGASVSAHHSWPVDNSRQLTVRGTVTGYDWNNPHVMIGLDVRTDAGRVEKWSVGGPSTSRMANNGWGKDTLKAGAVITATGYRFSDGQNILRLEKVVMADGKEMFLYGRR